MNMIIIIGRLPETKIKFPQSTKFGNRCCNCGHTIDYGGFCTCGINHDKCDQQNKAARRQVVS